MKTEVRPSIEVTIRETLATGEVRFTSRWVRDHPQGGWSSADNLGRDYRIHFGEDAARKAFGGWLHSQANKFGEAVEEPPPAPVPAVAADEEDDDLIG